MRSLFHEKLKAGGVGPPCFTPGKKAREAGGFLKLWRAMRSKNTCRPARSAWAASAAGMVNELATSGSLQEKLASRWSPTCRGHSAASFGNSNSVRDLQQLTPRELEHCGRLVEPVRYTRETDATRQLRGKKHLKVSLPKLRASPARRNVLVLQRAQQHEAGFLLQLFARLYGTNNINNCSFYCHQASGVGLASVTGSGTATVQLEDLEHADLCFRHWRKPGSNHPG